MNLFYSLLFITSAVVVNVIINDYSPLPDIQVVLINTVFNPLSFNDDTPKTA